MTFRFVAFTLPALVLGSDTPDVCVEGDDACLAKALVAGDVDSNSLHLLQMSSRQQEALQQSLEQEAASGNINIEDLEKLMDSPQELEKLLSDPKSEEEVATLTRSMIKDAPQRLKFLEDNMNASQSSSFRHTTTRHRPMCRDLESEEFPPLALRRWHDRRACRRAGLTDLSQHRHIVNMEIDNEFLPVFASAPLDQKKESIDRIVVVHHGVRTNANRYFCDLVNGAPDNVLVIAPWLSNTRVTATQWAGARANVTNVERKSVCWNSRFFEWMNGGNSAHSETTSFEVVDKLVQTLQRSHDHFPNLKQIFVSGFSAGCQMVSRWSVYTPVTVPKDNGDIPVTTIVGGCGTYLYFDALRPALSCSPMANSGEAHKCKTFEPPNNCPTYNTYRYGLKKGIDSHHHHSFDKNKYLTSFGPYSQTMKHVQANFILKDVRFIFGRHDVCNCKMQGYNNDGVCYKRNGSCKGHALGVYCEELLQGTNRLQRGLNYISALEHFYKERNQTYLPQMSLYEGGHSDSRFYKSDAFQGWVFGAKAAP